jgi:hypothetical protein
MGPFLGCRLVVSSCGASCVVSVCGHFWTSFGVMCCRWCSILLVASDWSSIQLAGASACLLALGSFLLAACVMLVCARVWVLVAEVMWGGWRSLLLAVGSFLLAACVVLGCDHFWVLVAEVLRGDWRSVLLVAGGQFSLLLARMACLMMVAGSFLLVVDALVLAGFSRVTLGLLWIGFAWVSEGLCVGFSCVVGGLFVGVPRGI